MAETSLTRGEGTASENVSAAREPGSPEREERAPRAMLMRDGRTEPARQGRRDARKVFTGRAGGRGPLALIPNGIVVRLLTNQTAEKAGELRLAHSPRPLKRTRALIPEGPV